MRGKEINEEEEGEKNQKSVSLLCTCVCKMLYSKLHGCMFIIMKKLNEIVDERITRLS